MMTSKRPISVDEAVAILLKAIKDNGIDQTKGLPDSLFHLVSSCTPICNVDLLISDENNNILLSWRDDRQHGTGWHIPGGCIRMKEMIATRIDKTALKEVGTKVLYDDSPMVVSESFITYDRPGLENQLERAHGIAFMYKCKLPEGFVINNGDKKEHDAGFLKWFDHIPDDLLKAHKEIYTNVLEDWFNDKYSK